MNKHEIIEQLNDLAERARDAYIHTNDEVAKKDNDAIMAAITTPRGRTSPRRPM